MKGLAGHSMAKDNCTKHLISLVVIWLSIGLAQAQQAIQFSQYFSNLLVLNPAYAGADDALSITFVNRNQWSGVNGSPNTTTFSGHTLFKNAHTGLGVNLIFDQINIHSNTSFTGIYSYRIKTSTNSYLSMGLQAGIYHLKSDYLSLIPSLQNPNDPNIGSGNLSRSAIQFGTGLFYKSPRLEVGLSAPIIYSSAIDGLSESQTALNTTPHYFLFARYNIDLSHHIQLQPGFLLKGKPGWPISLDINIAAIINKVLMFGLSYRSSETLSTIFQVKVLPQMKFGYAYDLPMSKIQRRNFNTHEIMLNYIFHYKDSNILSPR